MNKKVGMRRRERERECKVGNVEEGIIRKE
jgi:hypothetical protein